MLDGGDRSTSHFLLGWVVSLSQSCGLGSRCASLRTNQIDQLQAHCSSMGLCSFNDIGPFKMGHRLSTSHQSGPRTYIERVHSISAYMYCIAVILSTSDSPLRFSPSSAACRSFIDTNRSASVHKHACGHARPSSMRACGYLCARPRVCVHSSAYSPTCMGLRWIYPVTLQQCAPCPGLRMHI